MAISFSRLLVLPTFSLNILDANRLCVFHQVRECPAQLHCFFLSVYPGKIKQINFPLINVISIHTYFYFPSPVPTKKSPLQIPTECSQPPPLLQVITNSVSTNLPKKALKYPRELPGLISYFCSLKQPSCKGSSVSGFLKKQFKKKSKSSPES